MAYIVLAAIAILIAYLVYLVVRKDSHPRGQNTRDLLAAYDRYQETGELPDVIDGRIQSPAQPSPPVPREQLPPDRPYSGTSSGKVKSVFVKAQSERKLAHAIERESNHLVRSGYEIISVNVNKKGALSWGTKREQATITARKVS